MKRTLSLLTPVLSVLAAIMFWQTDQAPHSTFAQNLPPDCSFSFSFSATGAQTGQANLSTATPCVNWGVTFSATGTLAATVQLETSPDNSSWTAVPTTICSSTVQPPCVNTGTNPLGTLITQGSAKIAAYGAYVRINVTAKSGSGTGTVRVYGYKGTSAAVGGAGGAAGATGATGPPGPTGPTGPGATPGGVTGELQYNSVGTFAGAGNGGAGSSYVRPSGMIEIGPYLTTPSGGIGSFQNFLAPSNNFNAGAWTKTNLTVPNVDTNPPDGSALSADLFSTGDRSSLVTTSAGGSMKQCYDTGVAMTGRTFTLSGWAKYPSVAVTPIWTILSNTPTTATASSLTLTTNWVRYAVTGTFGVDAGTQVCAQFAPNGAGSGTMYLWGTQLEEGPIPTVFWNADSGFPQPVRGYGFTFSDNQGGPVMFNIGTNRINTQNDSFLIGNGNLIGAASGGLVFGNNNETTGSGFTFAFGTNLKPSGQSMMIGQSNAASKPTNSVANSVCLIGGSATGDASTNGICQLWLVPGPTGETGVVRIGNRATTPATCGTGNYKAGSLFYNSAIGALQVCGNDSLWHGGNSLSGITPSIGGGLLAPGACATDTVTVTGAAVGMGASATPDTDPGDGAEWKAYISAPDTVTVKVCAIVAVTPTASAYNVRVLP